jgi:hypothetical protein
MAKSSIPAVETVVTDEVATDTESTEQGFEFNLDTLIDDYVAGRVSKLDAKKWLETNMTDSIMSGKLEHAQAYVAVLQKLNDTQRSGGRKASEGLPSEDYATAIVARAAAFYRVARDLMSGEIVPSDVPQAQRDDVKSLLAMHVEGTSKLTVGPDTDKAASEPVESLAGARVIGNNQLIAHLKDIVDGKATHVEGFPFVLETGKTYRMSEIANLKTPVYPDGVSVGHLASRFTHKKAERFPAGWVYAKAQSKNGEGEVHGVRYVG